MRKCLIPIAALCAVFCRPAYAEATLAGCTSIEHVTDAASKPNGPHKLTDQQAAIVVGIIRKAMPGYPFEMPVYWLDSAENKVLVLSATYQTTACMFRFDGAEREDMIKRVMGDAI